MNRYEERLTRLAGAALILGPLLLVCAALAAAAGLGSGSGRWYDNWLEGLLMVCGFSVQLPGLLQLCRRIGETHPGLGIAATLTSVLGIAGALIPSVVRINSSVELGRGITVEQLDRVHNVSGANDPYIFLLPFILCFFLTNFLVAFGMWRAQVGPRFVPIALVLGNLLFIFGQSSSEVNYLAYIAGVSLWLLGLAPNGLHLLRGTAASSLQGAKTGW